VVSVASAAGGRIKRDNVCGGVDALDDVESGEGDGLRFFICAHALDVWFDCFDDVFVILPTCRGV